MPRKGKVAAVVGWHSHNSSCAITCQHIFAHPDGNLFTREGVDGIGSCEYAADALHLGLPLAFAAIFGPGYVLLHLGALLGGGDARNHLMLWA